METASSKKDNNSNTNHNSGRGSNVGIVESKSNVSNANAKPKVALKQVKISNGAEFVSNTNMQMSQAMVSGSTDEQDIFKVIKNKIRNYMNKNSFFINLLILT